MIRSARNFLNYFCTQGHHIRPNIYVIRKKNLSFAMLQSSSYVPDSYIYEHQSDTHVFVQSEHKWYCRTGLQNCLANSFIDKKCPKCPKISCLGMSEIIQQSDANEVKFILCEYYNYCIFLQDCAGCNKCNQGFLPTFRLKI